ncbi:hypothetical protein ACGFJ7_29060 [Actinoplanes sp. NPDC048988]
MSTSRLRTLFIQPTGSAKTGLTELKLYQRGAAGPVLEVKASGA